MIHSKTSTSSSSHSLLFFMFIVSFLTILESVFLLHVFDRGPLSASLWDFWLLLFHVASASVKCFFLIVISVLCTINNDNNLQPLKPMTQWAVFHIFLRYFFVCFWFHFYFTCRTLADYASNALIISLDSCIKTFRIIFF